MTANPVAARELQERFRTLRSPILISVWILAAGALTFLAYIVAREAAETRLAGSGAGLGSVFAASSMGSFILHAVLLGLLTAVVLIVPGQAAVAIVGERERQTLPLLQSSQLSGFSIVMGKLISSLAFILLLLVVVLPLLVIPVLLGGVSVWEALWGLLMVGLTAVTVGALSIWISARARSMQGAVLGSYVLAALLVFGSLALVVAEVFLAEPEDTGRTRYQGGIARDDGREIYSSWLRPYIALVDASTDTLRFGREVVISPYEPFRQVLALRQGFAMGSLLYDFGGGGGDDGWVTFARAEPAVLAFDSVAVMGMQETRTVRQVDPIRGQVWWRNVVFQLTVTALAILLATRLVKAPRKGLRMRRRGRSRSAAAAEPSVDVEVDVEEVIVDAT